MSHPAPRRCEVRGGTFLDGPDGPLHPMQVRGLRGASLSPQPVTGRPRSSSDRATKPARPAVDFCPPNKPTTPRPGLVRRLRAGRRLRQGTPGSPLTCLPPAYRNAKALAGKLKTPRRAFANHLILRRKTGAGEGIRTLDPNLGKVVRWL